MPDQPRDREPREHPSLAEKPHDGLDAPSLENRVEDEARELVTEARGAAAAARRPWYLVVRRGRTLLAVYAALLALFGLLAWWVHVHPVLAIDVTITSALQANQPAWLKLIMIAVSYQGYNIWLNIGLIVLAAALFWLVDLRLEAIVVVLLSSASALLNGVIKLLVDRPRPPARLVEILAGGGGPSFPSGHVMSYVAFWGLLFSFGIMLFRGKRWWRIVLIGVSALMVMLVGPSRIYLGDHWASDVLGAYLIGGALLGIALWLYLLLKERGVLAPRRRWSWYRHAH
jgi:membrane-associated phospholipid phosphatase